MQFIMLETNEQKSAEIAVHLVRYSNLSVTGLQKITAKNTP